MVRPRLNDRRCRSGCWRCRERRVKCSEERPQCRQCARLGLDCCYEIRLIWKKVSVLDDRLWKRPAKRRARHQSEFRSPDWDGDDASLFLEQASCPSAEDWMFLNTTWEDFRARSGSHSTSRESDDGNGRDEHSLESPISTHGIDYSSPRFSTPASFPPSLPSPSWSSHDSQTSISPSTCDAPFEMDLDLGFRLGVNDSEGTDLFAPDTLFGSSEICFDIPASPSSHGLSSTDLYLLSYFQHTMTPHCTLSRLYNPYLDIVARMGLSRPETSVMPAILAAAASQLASLGDNRFKKHIWQYRAQALGLLRSDLLHCESAYLVKGQWEPVFATVLMLCFFDISNKCEESWVAHTQCARRLLLLPQISPSELSQEQIDLCKFVSTYFVFHNALARTAWDCGSYFASEDWPFRDKSNDWTIDQLFGCSPELLELIDSISCLGEEKDRIENGNSNEDSIQGTLAAIRKKRNTIEKRLYSLHQTPYSEQPVELSSSGSASLIPASRFTPIDEVCVIAETKRLATLLYLYHRIDSLPPQTPVMVRLTERILSLLTRVSLRTNTILWPLFIVGTMGVQPVREDHRKLVLERLTALQRTRELGNVQRAKAVVEAVWRQRDLRYSASSGETEVSRWKRIIAGNGGKLSLS